VRTALAAAVVIIGLGFVLSFRTENLASVGPDFVAQVKAARCQAGERIELRIFPHPWTMWAPCPVG